MPSSCCSSEVWIIETTNSQVVQVGNLYRDNLPPITSPPGSLDVDDDDEMQNSTVELIDEDAVEWQVSPPRRTRSGREVVRPHHVRDN